MWIRINWVCDRTAQALGEYLDGTLPLRRRRGVEAHLRECVSCRHELSSLRRTLALLSDLPRRELSESFDAALSARLDRLRPAGGSLNSGLPLTELRSSATRYLRAPWPSEARRWAPVGAMAAVAAALLAWNMQPPAPVLAPHQRPPAYVSMVVREHEMLGTGADMNRTVVNHNLGGDPLGDGDDE
jgi:anti-sigma factor RsiW